MYRAVLLDAMGTLVELEPPWDRLAAALGGEVPAARVEGAFRAEMAYYREHSEEERDERSLADLRRRCAAVLSRGLGIPVDVDLLLSALRFRAHRDARGALERLRERDLRLVCVSNWDFTLPGVLDRVGLGALLDGVVASATAGARKPEPAIFASALEIAGCRAEEALHVGDSAAEDIAGAKSAGIDALLLDRGGEGDIASLSEIEDHLGR